MGHSRSSAMSPFDKAHTTSYSTLIETMRLRDIAGYFSKVADFDPPRLNLAPPQGVIPVEFRGDLWHPKTRVPGLSCLRDPTFSHFSRTPTCDGQTDGRTRGHG